MGQAHRIALPDVRDVEMQSLSPNGGTRQGWRDHVGRIAKYAALGVTLGAVLVVLVLVVVKVAPSHLVSSHGLTRNERAKRAHSDLSPPGRGDDVLTQPERTVR